MAVLAAVLALCMGIFAACEVTVASSEESSVVISANTGSSSSEDTASSESEDSASDGDSGSSESEEADSEDSDSEETDSKDSDSSVTVSGTVSLYSTYLEMVEAGEYEGTFASWLQEYGFTESVTWTSSENAYSTSINTSLLSVVSIVITGTYSYTSSSKKPGSSTATTTLCISGSGVLYDVDRDEGDAYIITNCHVVYDGAITEDGVTYTPVGDLSCNAYLYGLESTAYAIEFSVVGYSLTNDVAVCRVVDSDVLKSSLATAATVGDSDTVAVGDQNYLIGNALGDGITATSGIVSVVDEDVTVTGGDGTTTVTVRAMRTDAAAYSGNSGGGMFNADGELIGILFAGYSDGDNMSFCLPINTVVAIADSILDSCDGTTKTTTKFTLGITAYTAATKQVYVNETNAVGTEDTVAIYSVTEGSAAETAGLQAEDVIVSLTGADGTVKEVTHDWHLSDFLWTVRSGDTFTVTVERDGTETEITVTADEDSFSAVA